MNPCKKLFLVWCFFIHELKSRKPEMYDITNYEYTRISPHFPCFQKQVVSFQSEREGPQRLPNFVEGCFSEATHVDMDLTAWVMVKPIKYNYQNILFPEPDIYIIIFTFWRPSLAQNNEYIQFPQSYLFQVVNIFGCNFFTICDKLTK